MVGTRFQRSHGRLPSLLFAVIAFTVLLIESRNHRAGVCADRVGLDPISAEGKGLIHLHHAEYNTASDYAGRTKTSGSS